MNFLLFVNLWEKERDGAALSIGPRGTRTRLPASSAAYGAHVLQTILHYAERIRQRGRRTRSEAAACTSAGASLPALEASRASRTDRYYIERPAEWQSSGWPTCKPMTPRICSAIRDSRPQNLSAAVAEGDVALTWDAPTYDADARTGYRILRAEAGGSFEVLAADISSTETTWTDESPGVGVYDYAVRALYDDVYASRESAKATATVGDTAGTAAPSVDDPKTYAVREGETAVATLAATDTDSPASAFTWSITGGADQTKFAITTAGALSFKAAKDYESPDDTGSDGSYAVTVQVSDGAQTGTADLTVTLSNVNEAPTANAGTDQTEIAEGATVTLSASGTDPDAGDTLSYAWTKTAGPAVTLSGADTATATFTAPSDLTADAVFTFKLTVTDADRLSATDTVSVTVEATERAAPAVTGTTAFTVAEGATAVGTLTATDTDTDADDLTWSITGGADQAKFAVTAAGVLSFKAAKDYESPDDTGSDGSYAVTVQVSDGAQTGTADLTVTLSNVNEAPTANAGTDQTEIAEGATVTLTGFGDRPGCRGHPELRLDEDRGPGGDAVRCEHGDSDVHGAVGPDGGRRVHLQAHGDGRRTASPPRTPCRSPSRRRSERRRRSPGRRRSRLRRARRRWELSPPRTRTPMPTTSPGPSRVARTRRSSRSPRRGCCHSRPRRTTRRRTTREATGATR